MRTPLPCSALARRWVLVVAGVLSTGAVAQAQTLNYPTAKATNVAATFTSIASTGTAIATANTDNDNSAAQNIGFPFSFNGASFTQFVLSTNGFIKLGSAAPSSASLFFTPETTLGSDVFSSTNAADVNIISPFNCDLESGATPATYQVLTSGTAGSRVCTIQWTGVRDKQMTNAPQYTGFNFQVKLYEGTNRVELVYDMPTAGTGTDALRYSGAGVKGSGAASGQVVTFTKTSGSAWSGATAQGTIYTGNTLNYRQTFLPDAGRTFRFDPLLANDAAVASIFTLGELPVPAALPHAVQASVTNLGTAAQTNLVVTLNVTGANTFTDTKTVASLAAGATATVTFANYPTTLNAGTNTVTVTIPSDDNNSNNTGTYGQLVTTNRITYLDQAGTLNATGVGVGQAGGALVAKYTLAAASALSDVVLTFAASTGNTSTYQVVLYDATGAGGTPGAVLYTSATQTRTAAAGSTTVTIPAVAVPANFYIGVKELVTNPALAYQVEDPLKPNTYYYSLDGATSWTSVNTTTLRTRLAIEAGLTTPAACQAPTGLTATNITATGATLTFTVPSGASSYTVTYTPTGGTATTVTPTPTGSPVTLTGLAPGTTYSVSVTASCGAGQTSGAATTTFTTPIANDDPTGAIALTVSSTCTPTNGTNAGATTTTVNGYTNPGTCGIAVNPKDVWYKFTTQAGQTAATVTVTGNPAGLVRVFSATSSAGPFTQVSCSAGSTNNTVAPALTVAGLTPNTTYYISVAGYGSGDTQGAFTICVTTPAAATCAPVTNAAATSTSSTATASSAQVTFTAASGASSYQVTVAPTAGGASSSTSVTGSPASFTNLTPSTAYTATITTICSNGGVSSPVTVTFTSAAPPTAPANDECAGAVTLPVNTTCVPTNGTTVGATQSLAAITCNNFTGNADDDVWYKFVAINTGCTVTVVGGPALDAVVDVRSGTCAASTNIGCADATVLGGTEVVTLAGLTVGTTYYVRVYGYGTGPTTADAFTICVTGTAAPGTCPAVTGLAAGSTTATGTTLTFTAAAGATNYTVTYTPTGGTATTVTPTPTGSPVTLTGLAPGTTYAVRVVTNCSATSASTAATTSFTTLSPAPTNVAAGSITATTASITFTAATGATSYTVTYTAAGGQPRTVTVTGSPANLTGLTALTGYTVTVVANYAGGGASSPVTITFTTPQGLGVRATLGGGELAVFPNPAHHAFTVSVPALGARTAELELVNALGQVVRRQSLSLTAGGTRVAVEATGLATGLYWVRVQAGGETAVTRLSLE